MDGRALVNTRSAMAGVAALVALAGAAQPALSHAVELIPVKLIAAEGDLGWVQREVGSSAQRARVSLGGYNLYQYPDILNTLNRIFAPSTYNPTGPSFDGSPEARVKRAIKYVEDSGLDAWGLSEVNGTNGTQILEGLKKEYPHQTRRAGESCANTSGACSSLPFVVNGGVALISKYPIEETYQHVFVNYAPASPELLINKGVNLARLDVNGERLWVATAHFQADDSLDDEISDTDTIRQAQAQELRKFIANHVPRGDKLVFMGDANVPYFNGMNPSKLDSDGRSQIDQLAQNMGLKIQNMRDQPFTYDSRTNPLIGDNWMETLDVFASNDQVQLKDTAVTPIPSKDTPSDHYPIRTVAEWDPGSASIKPGQVASYNISPTYLERAAYFVKNSTSFAIRYAFKKILQAALFVAKTATDATQFVYHAIEAAYHAVFGGNSTDKDKPTVEIKKDLNDSEPTNPDTAKNPNVEKTDSKKANLSPAQHKERSGGLELDNSGTGDGGHGGMSNKLNNDSTGGNVQTAGDAISAGGKGSNGRQAGTVARNGGNSGNGGNGHGPSGRWEGGKTPTNSTGGDPGAPGDTGFIGKDGTADIKGTGKLDNPRPPLKNSYHPGGSWGYAPEPATTGTSAVGTSTVGTGTGAVKSTPGTVGGAAKSSPGSTTTTSGSSTGASMGGLDSARPDKTGSSKSTPGGTGTAGGANKNTPGGSASDHSSEAGSSGASHATSGTGAGDSS